MNVSDGFTNIGYPRVSHSRLHQVDGAPAFFTSLPGVPQGDADVHAAALDEFVPSCGLSHAPTLALQVHLLAETGDGNRQFSGLQWHNVANLG